MAEATAALVGYGSRRPKPYRLKGALAAGETLGQSATKKERIKVSDLASIAARVKPSAITGTLTVELFPMLADAGDDDTTGTRATTGAPTAVTTTTATEVLIEMDLRGEQYVELVLTMSGGLTDEATIDYAEIFGVSG